MHADGCAEIKTRKHHFALGQNDAFSFFYCIFCRGMVNRIAVMADFGCKKTASLEAVKTQWQG